MTGRPTLADLTPAQADAITRFASQHGRRWKATLNHAWATGLDERHVDGALLRQIRNQRGPSWLARLTLKERPPN